MVERKLLSLKSVCSSAVFACNKVTVRRAQCHSGKFSHVLHKPFQDVTIKML